jgi:asparagine synthase (glutamine-hydrolysing)
VLGDAATIEDLYGISREIMPPSVRRALLRTSDDTPSASAAPLHGPAGLHPVNAMTLLESGRYLLDTTLRQADIMSMAVSLEVRVPLLNHRVAEMAIRTPTAWRLRSGTPKPLLLDALPRALPASIVHRRKGTFSLPYATWLRGPYRAVAEDLLLSPRTQARGLFDPAAVRQLWDSFVEGRSNWSGVWALASLEGWCRATLDVSPLDAPALAVSLPTPPALL